MKRSIFLVCFVVFGVVSLSAIGSIVSVAQSGWQTDSISYGSVHVNSIIGVVDIVIPLGENQFKTLFRELWDILT